MVIVVVFVVVIVVVSVVVIVVVVVVVVVVVAGFESHALGDKSEKEDPSQHVPRWEESVGIMCLNIKSLFIPRSR